MMMFMRYWVPVIVLCAIIFLQSSFATPDELPRWPFSDKLLHAGIYGLLGMLFCRAFNTLAALHGKTAWIVLAAAAAATLYGLSDEWHQSFVADRSAEAADLLADAVGAVLGAAAYGVFQKKRLGHAQK